MRVVADAVVAILTAAVRCMFTNCFTNVGYLMGYGIVTSSVGLIIHFGVV